MLKCSMRHWLLLLLFNQTVERLVSRLWASLTSRRRFAGANSDAKLELYLRFSRDSGLSFALALVDRTRGVDLLVGARISRRPRSPWKPIIRFEWLERAGKQD